MQITAAAASLIRTMRDEAGASEQTALRIEKTSTSNGQADLGIVLADRPVAGDVATEQAGVTIYVERALDASMADAVLDAETTKDGSRLVVRS